MKRALLLALPFLCAQLATAQSSAVPGAISYQGRVADAAGVPIGDIAPVNRKVTLRIYDQASATTPLYAEEQTVTINKGVFSVLLGQGLQVGTEPKPPIAGVFNGAERFLGITVDDGGPANDPEITPRQQIVSTAYAFRAKQAENASSVTQTSGTSTFNTINANTLDLSGRTTIQGSQALEFGAGLTKGDFAGQIDYNGHVLNINGGRASNSEKARLKIWADGGTEFTGQIRFPGNGQHIELKDSNNGIGVQEQTTYMRSFDDFAWYRRGAHSDQALSSGGGTTLMSLTNSGLTLGVGSFRGTLDGAISRGDNHAVFAQSFGGGHSFGSQDWTTFSRTARNFAWYQGGGNSSGDGDAGGGTTLARLDDTGLRIMGPRNVAGHEGNSGKIGYQTYSDGLDILGAGTQGNRKITLHTEGGMEVRGGISGSGLMAANNFEARTAGSSFTRDIRITGNDGDLRFPHTWAIHTHGGGLEFWYQNGMKSYVNGAGDYVKTSDRTLKRDIKPIALALEKVLELQPATYHYKSEPKGTQTSYGFIAQEVQEVLPDLVHKHDSGVLGLNYEGFVPVAIAAIQEQQKQIEAKDAEIAALKKELAAAQETNTLQDTRLASIEKALNLKAPAAAPAKKETKVASRR